MKKLISLIFVLLLSGCSLYPNNYAKAVELCADNDGINILNVGPFSYDVVCNNGAEFRHFAKWAPQP